MGGKTETVEIQGDVGYGLWNYELPYRKKRNTETSDDGPMQDIFIDGKLKKTSFRSLKQITGFVRIQKDLEEGLNIKHGNSLQLAAAPQIMAGRNCFLVGSRKPSTGKSLAHMIPILAPLIEETFQTKKRLKRMMGPRVLIICASYKHGLTLEDELFHLCSDTKTGTHGLIKTGFVHENSRFTRQKKYAGGKAKEIGERDLDVIVVTVEYAVELIEQQRNGLTFESMSHLVIEDANILVKYHASELKRVFMEFKKYSARSFANQIVFVAGEWIPELDDWHREVVEEPILIISSAVQMLSYCKFRIEAIGTTSDQKFDRLTEILDKNTEARRILVVVTTYEAVLKLKLSCAEKGIDGIFLEGEGAVGPLMQFAKRKWDAIDTKRLMVVVADIDLRELNVSKASILIHYEIPLKSFRTFALRYSPMWSKGVPKNLQDFTSYVLVHTDDERMGMVAWKLAQLGAKVPEDVDEMATKFHRTRTQDAQLCMGFKCHADCQEFDQFKCLNRHFFRLEDFAEISDSHATGQVELYITQVIAPNLFTAKLLRFWRRDPVTNKVTDEVAFNELALQLHHDLKAKISEPGYKKELQSYSPGTKVLFHRREKYQNRYVLARGEIVKIATRSYLNYPCEVYVKGIDIGEVVKAHVSEIQAMPEEFENIPAYSIEVVLVNMVPPLGEKTFRDPGRGAVRQLLQKHSTLQADIALAAVGTIWVRRLAEIKKVNNDFIEVWDLGKTLIDKGIAVKDPVVLDKLHWKCEKLGLSVEAYRKHSVLWSKDAKFRREFYQEGDDYQWAFLDVLPTTLPEDVVVLEVKVLDLSMLNISVVRLEKFSKNIENLEKELTLAIEKEKMKFKWNDSYGFAEYYQTSMVVAVRRKDRYCRGYIKDVYRSSETPTFLVLLVDHGKELVVAMDNLHPCPKSFVSRLNFQTVQIIFGGIGWDSEAEEIQINEVLRNILFADNVPSTLTVVALKKLVRRPADLYHCYEVVGFQNGRNVADIIEETGCGSKLSGIQEIFDVVNKVVLKQPDPEKDDDEEDVEEVYCNVEPAGSDCDFDEWDIYGGDELIRQLAPDDDFIMTLTKIIDMMSESNNSKPATRNAMCDQNEVALKPKKTNLVTVMEETEQENKTAVVEAIPNGDTNVNAGSHNTADQNHLSDAVPGTSKEAKKEAMEAEAENRNSPESTGITKQPCVEWLQSDDFVYLRVLIPDVKDQKYEMERDKRTINWKSVEPPGYCFALRLFKKVKPDFVVKLLGQYVELKMEKQMKTGRWKSLSDTACIPWIKPEINFEDDGADWDVRTVVQSECSVQGYDSDDEIIERNLIEEAMIS